MIGELLVGLNALTGEQLNELLDLQLNTSERLCSLLWRRRIIDERTLLRVLSKQLGVPGILGTELAPSTEALSRVPAEVCERLCVLPIRSFSRSIVVAMRDPDERDAHHELAFCSGRIVRPMVALEGPLRHGIDRVHGSRGFSPMADIQPIRTEFVTTPPAPATADSNVPDLPSLDGVAHVNGPEDVVTILAVDDEPSILRLYQSMLPKSRYRVVTCDRGDQVLAACRRERPELVLLDALLPEMNGFELCRRIKGMAEGGAPSVILISAAYRRWQMQRELDGGLGADAYFEKPFDLTLLVERIEALLSRGRKARELNASRKTEALVKLRESLVALGQGRLHDAREALEFSIRLDPFSSRSHFYLGKTFETNGQVHEAMFAYEQAVGLDPESFHAMCSLAGLYQSEGFHARALETWQRAVMLSSDDKQREALFENIRRLKAL